MAADLNGTHATVIGGGLMGHGIAQVLAHAGMQVVVHDPYPEVLAAVPGRIAENLGSLGLDASAAERISLDGDLESAVGGADWVFEAAPEKLELKQDLFRRMDAAAPASAVLATNTSVIRVGDVAAQSSNRARIVGTHWWNPPYLVPLVEVVQGPDTSDETVRRTINLLDALDKTPVHVRRDVAGFVGNRLQHALWREAFNLVEAGVCDAETVDTVVKAGFGRRLAVLGPIENADMVGLDLTLSIHEYVLPSLDPPSGPSGGLRERVERGELGMKTGQGFRNWTKDEADGVRRRVSAHLAASASPHPEGEDK